MKLLAAIAAACLCASAFGQSGVRYDQRVSTVATNVPSGAAANVMAIPNAMVTICADGNCFATASIFSDQGLTVPASNPMKTNGQGFFGFYAAAGSYFYKVVLPSGAVQGIYPFTLGGSGTAGITALTGDVIASGPGSTSSALAAITAAGTCGDATHVGQITKDTKGRVTGCTPVAITGGSAPAGTNNDLQIFGTSSSLAADTGNLTNNSTTHNFHQKQINGIPYAGNYSTGSNGIANAFAATGAGVIINDSENAGDTAQFGPTSSTIFDMQSGTLGTRLHNCVPNPYTVPFRVSFSNCWTDVIYTDVPSTASGQGGIPFRQIGTFSSGPGYNLGNIGGGGLSGIDQGWAFDGGLNIAVDAYRDGISNALEINSNKHSQGDFQNIESRAWCWGGNTDLSGEGCVNVSLQGGQQAVFSVGTITATTGTGDLTPVTTANQISAGNFLVDTQTARASGTLTGTGSQAWAESTYLNTLATAGGLTPSTGDCLTISAIHRSTVAGTPQSVTVTCTVGALGPLSTGIAYLASNQTPEQVKITSAPAPVAGVQTLTLLAYLPHGIGSNMIQGGTKGCLSFDANLSISGRSTYYVFGSKDSTHFIYGFLVHGAMQGNTLPMIGNEPETLSTPNNGYHIYPCAQVAYINADSPGAAFHLEENDIPFAIADTVEFPFNPAVNASQLNLDQALLTPSNGGGSNSIHANYSGPGINGNYVGFSLINGNPASMYLGTGGGWANAPAAGAVVGPYSAGIRFTGPPAVAGQTIFPVTDLTTSVYGLFDTSAGKITANAPANQIEFSKSVLVGSNLAVNGAFSLGGGFTAANIVINNLTSNPNPPLLVQEQFVFGTCRGIHFNDTVSDTGRICVSQTGGGEGMMHFGAGFAMPDILTLEKDGSSNLHANFYGDLNVIPNGSTNGAISFGAGSGAPAIKIYDGGAGSRLGWGVQSNEMQSFINTGAHYSWNKGGDLQTSGTNELMRLLSGTGALLIGTTTDNGVDKLQINGSFSTTGPIASGATPPTACGSATGCAALAEASTAGTPTASQAYIRADSTSHTFKSSINNSSEASLTQTIASGTSALGTSAIASGACATVVTTAATGTATTDVVPWGFNGDPTAITGYAPSASGMLKIIAYPTANSVNFKVCNNTSASVTPGAVTLNWRITR